MDYKLLPDLHENDDESFGVGQTFDKHEKLDQTIDAEQNQMEQNPTGIMDLSWKALIPNKFLKF